MIESFALSVRDEIGVARAAELATGGVPLPEGLVRDPGDVSLVGPDGGETPSQATAAERWPDGSVRWLSLAFLADVPRQGAAEYALVTRPSRLRDAPPAVVVAKSLDGLAVDTGSVSFLVRTDPFDPLAGFPGLDGVELAAAGPAGRYVAALDPHVRLDVLDRGSLFVRVRAAGSFVADDGSKLFDFEADVEAVAGSAEVALDVRLVNREPGQTTAVTGWTVRCGVKGATAACCGVFEHVHRSRHPFALRHDGGGHTKGIFVAPQLESESDDWEDASEPGYAGKWEWAELEGRHGSGWIAVERGDSRLAVALPRFADDNPTTLSWDREVVDIGLWPARSGPLELTQGVAVTRRIVFAPDVGTPVDASRFAARAASPLVVDSGTLAFSSGAVPPVLARRPDRHPGLESHIRGELFSWCLSGQSTGLLDRGDCAEVATGPRAGFTANNEHDALWALLLHYLRSGERAYLESALSYADHIVDVDVIHHSDLNAFEQGGVRAHGVNHVHYVPARTADGPVVTSIDTGHMWVEGLLLIGALSGHRRYVDAAYRIGECLLRLEAMGWTRPEPGPRNAGWPLVALAALYRSTGDQRWLDAARRVAARAAEAQGADGRWTMRLGFWDGYCAWQNCVLLTGLARLLELDPEPSTQLEESFRFGANALLELGRYDDGGFVYLDRSDYRWVSRTGLIREALAAAYDRTGEERFLLAGLEGGSWYRSGRDVASSNDIAEWRGHLRFLGALEHAGIELDLGAGSTKAATF